MGFACVCSVLVLLCVCVCVCVSVCVCVCGLRPAGSLKNAGSSTNTDIPFEERVFLIIKHSGQLQLLGGIHDDSTTNLDRFKASPHRFHSNCIWTVWFRWFILSLLQNAAEALEERCMRLPEKCLRCRGSLFNVFCQGQPIEVFCLLFFYFCFRS